MVERAEEIYQALLESGVQEEDILQEIEKKEKEFCGIMTRPAILHLIAKDHGVDVHSKENKEMLKYIAEEVVDNNDFAIPISSIIEGMKNIVITGKITEITGEREFTRKDSSVGKVAFFQICDESAKMKVVLWDDQINIIKSEYFKEGQIIQVIGGYSKKGFKDPFEVHLSKKGKIILAPEETKLPKAEVKEISKPDGKEAPAPHSKSTIRGLYEKEGFIKSISGTAKIDEFKEVTKKNGGIIFLLKLSLSDKTSSIKVNIWDIKATEIFPLIEDGKNVRLTNVTIKENTYTNTKELSFTKSSRLEII